MRLPAAALIALVGAGCGVPDLDLGGKQCPCVTGWVCDTPTNTCVIDPSLPDAPPGTPDARRADAAMVTCPSGYLPIAGATSRYRIDSNSTDWLAAEQDCESDGAGTHLVIFDDVTEHGLIAPMVAGGHWIGITDRVTEGTWLAVTGQAAFYTGGAGPGSATNDCGRLRDDDAIDGRSCINSERYICECDGIAANPASY